MFTRSMDRTSQADIHPVEAQLAGLRLLRFPVLRLLLQASTWLLTWTYRISRSNFRLWVFSARHYPTWFSTLAYLHSYQTSSLARQTVPAYRDFLRERGASPRWLQLETFPETNKDNYVRAYDFEDRCLSGEIRLAGTVIDESSGSTGQPFNWMRSGRELEDIHVGIGNYMKFSFPGDKLFTINAFSMGAWATGVNTGIAAGRVGIVKSTGPEIDKIIDTLKVFGPGFDYLIAGYPPFLKRLIDAMDQQGFPWDDYKIAGMVGGEAMTEALRDYLERRLTKVRSGYGASDLQIGIAAEFDFTVWLRRRLIADASLRDKFLGHGEDRIPMVFQFNPLETFIEINDDSEVVVTLNNASIMSPKIRYNIGDEGKIMSYQEAAKVLQEHDGSAWQEASHSFNGTSVVLPILFLYGRTDSTVSYMGANIYPQDVEYGLYADTARAAIIDSFCLSSVETEQLETRIAINVQLEDGADLNESEVTMMSDAIRKDVIDHLAGVNRDFATSLDEDRSTADIRVALFKYGTGPFASQGNSIKNKYLVTDN